MSSMDVPVGSRTLRSLLWAAICITVLALGVAACREDSSEQDAGHPSETPAAASDTPLASPMGARRLLEPDSPTGASLSLPRVQIGSETRTVLGAAPREVLLWRDPVTLAETLEVRVPLPRALRGSEEALRIDVSVSVQPEAFRDKDPMAARLTTTGRQRLAAAPIVLSAERLAHDAEVTVTIAVPPSMNGLAALVDAVARPLPPVTQQWHGGPFTVSTNDRLAFGYGVEPEGEHAGWPPVRFRVFGRADDAEERLLFDRRLDPATDARDRGWLDAEIPLADVTSPRTTFRFEVRVQPIEGGTSDQSFAVFSAPEVVPGRSGAVSTDPDRPYNVILISLDTLRARSVGAYGYARDTTPAIDRRVAARGALVRAAVAPIPFTPPAHMSMLTGLEPCAHRVEDRHGVLPPDRLTLAEVLRHEGYRTAAFTENGYVAAGAGFARGFDRYFEQLSEESAAPGFAAEVFAEAANWLDREGSRPFFLFVHTYQVHDPYVPPRGYEEVFAGDGVTNEYAAQHRAAVDAYDREIRYLDDIVAGFLDRLEVRGLDERTVLVITSDHGEAFGEHFWTGHGLDTHDEALLVPLLVRAPGLVPAGLELEGPIGLIDLVPTLLDLLDLPAPPDLQGRSHATVLRGESDVTRTRPIVSTSANNASVRTRDSKLIRGLGNAQRVLYDLSADPDEKKNLIEERPDEATALEAVYLDWRTRCDALAAAAAAGDARRGEKQPGWLINRDDIDEKLRSLGYIE